jgi:coenzyme PQQ biosynthesis protein PqqD
MESKIDASKIFIPSEEIVSREIEGEFIIVPLVSGIAEFDDDLFTLNETARSIWKRLDGKKSLQDVIQELATEYGAPENEIEKDVLGLVTELIKRRMLVEVPRDQG